MRRVADIREEIADNSKHIKNKMTLEMLSTMTALYAKFYNDKTFRELSKQDIDRLLIINNVMRIDNARQLHILSVTSRC